MSKTIDTTPLEVVTDPCTGGHSATLWFEVAITRGGYTKNVSRYEQYTWPGTPPDPVPRSCNEPEPRPAGARPGAADPADVSGQALALRGPLTPSPPSPAAVPPPGPCMPGGGPRFPTM